MKGGVGLIPLAGIVAGRYIRGVNVEAGPRTGTFILSKPAEQTGTGEMAICETVPSQAEGALKYDTDKNRLDLLPFEALEEVGWVMTYGAKKYSPNNWRKGFAVPRVLGAALRHLFAYMRGEKLDPESGRSHLAHAVCMILFALTFDLEERDGKAK